MDYKLALRGKTLLQALTKQLSAPRRSPKYGYSAIIEMCLKLYPKNPYVKRLISEANRQLNLGVSGATKAAHAGTED
jgi:hypothetical protein